MHSKNNVVSRPAIRRSAHEYQGFGDFLPVSFLGVWFGSRTFWLSLGLVSRPSRALSLARLDFLECLCLCRHRSSCYADEESSLPRSTNVARIMIFAPATAVRVAGGFHDAPKRTGDLRRALVFWLPRTGEGAA